MTWPFFNAAIDSKLRGCDLVGLKVRDVFAAGCVKGRTSVTQSKTGKPVPFEITETTRLPLERWIADPEIIGSEYLRPSRLHASRHLSTRQYARIMREWVTSIGLEPSAYGTHSMRRTKVAQIYKKTGHLRAAQKLSVSVGSMLPRGFTELVIRACRSNFSLAMSLKRTKRTFAPAAMSVSS